MSRKSSVITILVLLLFAIYFYNFQKSLSSPSQVNAIKGDINIGANPTGGVACASGEIPVSNGTKMVCSPKQDLIQWTEIGARPTIMQPNDTLGGLIRSTAAGASYITGGNVGIGTTGPTQRLDLGTGGNFKIQSSNDGNNGIVYIYDTAGAAAGQLYAVAGDLKIYSPADVLFNQVGNVGIGTTAPGAKLEVNGGTTNSITIAKFFNAVDTTGESVELLVGKSEGSGQSGRIMYVHDSAIASNRYLGLGTEGGGTPLVVTNGGNVGIGTTAPGAKLEVNGGEIFVVNAEAGSGQLRVGSVNGYPGLYSFTTSKPMSLRSDTGMRFSGSGDDMSSTADMVIDSSGNVGIGTTGPGGKLEIFNDGSSFDDRFRFGFQGAAGLNRGIDFSVDAAGNGGTIQGVIVSTGGAATLSLNPSGGNVGIGTTNPGYKLEVIGGSVYANGSSRDFKKHITNLEVDSGKIYQLRPVSYDYREQYKGMGFNLAGGRQIGLIAEEVYDVIPELVITLPDKKTANIEYPKLSVLLLDQMQKQKKTLDEQQKKIDYLEKKVNQLLEQQPDEEK